MNDPTLCMVHEGIGNYGAIARVALSGAKAALDAGWRVTVIAERLDPALAREVEWLKLHVPPRVFVYKWLVTRRIIRRVIGSRRFDIVHVHQPQVASLADVMQCHYLTRAAYERKCLAGDGPLRARASQWQEAMVVPAEDRFFRKWNPRTWMLFDSVLTRDEFRRMYGMPPRQDVLLYPCPKARIPTQSDRRAARRRWVANREGIVVGYLGGMSRRKGWTRLLEAVRRDPGLVLLMGGPRTESYCNPELGNRLVATGLVDDIDEFYAACDVFVVPSVFEPFGLVAFEAASRGVPVIAASGVGALRHMSDYGAAEQWHDGEPLGPIARRMAAHRAKYEESARRLSSDFSEARYGERLLSYYGRILDDKRIAMGAGARR